MKPCQADIVRKNVRTRVRTRIFLLFFFATVLLSTVPAFSQRGTLDLNVGQTSDQFGAIPAATSPLVDINGELTIKMPNLKKGGASIVAGGEIRVPIDATDHAKEIALYGGLAWTFHQNLSIGVDAQVRKIYMPSQTVDGETFVRNNMELFQLPIVIKYKFGPERRAFLEARGEPEFTPHFKGVPLSTLGIPNPSFDHGYTVRASAGYNFGQWWYVKASAETRYFKFLTNTTGNPNGLYNWKSNIVTGGIGVRF